MSLILRAVRIALGALMLIGVALNFANVVGRYVFLRPIIWAEEVLVFIMIWSVMLGATLVTWENAHLRMDALYHLVTPRLKRWLNAVSVLAGLVAGLFVLVQSARVVALVLSTGQRSVVAEIPMTLAYGALPVSFALIVVAVLVRGRGFIRGGE